MNVRFDVDTHEEAAVLVETLGMAQYRVFATEEANGIFESHSWIVVVEVPDESVVADDSFTWEDLK